MKTLISTLFLGAGLVLGGCGNEENNSKIIQYTIQDTLDNPILEDKMGKFSGTLLTYEIINSKNLYLLTVKGNIDDKHNEIQFIDMNNTNSLLNLGKVTFYKNNYENEITTFANGSTAVWLFEDKTEFYHESDSSKLSQEIIKEARNQMENYFNPLYKKLRKRSDSLHNKEINLKNKEKVDNFFN